MPDKFEKIAEVNVELGQTKVEFKGLDLDDTFELRFELENTDAKFAKRIKTTLVNEAAAAMAEKFSPNYAELEKRVAELQLDRASGGALDSIGGNMTGLTRTIGEPDDSFRSRILSRLVGEDNDDGKFADRIQRKLLPELSVSCPKCGAVEGDSCETPDGDDYRDTYFHKDRRLMALCIDPVSED